MKNFINKIFNKKPSKKSPDFIVTYRWLDEEGTVETTTATSCGLAWLETDPCIEVLEVVEA